jgi:seryl-tRNA synthetase
MGIEINAVFLKPYTDSQALLELRSRANRTIQTGSAPQNQKLAQLGEDLLRLRHQVHEVTLVQSQLKLEIEQLKHIFAQQSQLKLEIEQLKHIFAQQSQDYESITQELSSIHYTISMMRMPVYKKLSRILRLFLTSSR